MRYIFFVSTFWIVIVATAQDTTTHYRNNGTSYKRSDYVDNLTRCINITPLIYAASNRFTFSDKQSNIEYSPNETPSIGLRLQHKWLGLTFIYGPKNMQEQARGISDYYSAGLTSYGKKIGFDAYYVRNQGYYISNHKALETIKPDFKTTRIYPQRSDLVTASAGLNVYYIFNNHRFSYRSSFLQNEIQKKSAGSFILTKSASYYTIKADSSIVPGVYKSEIPDISQLRHGEFYTMGIMPGYAFTLVAVKRLYFTLSLSYGLMYQFQDYKAEDIGESYSVSRQIWLSRGLARFSTGFNSRYFYCGISGVGDNYNIQLRESSRLQYSIGNVQLFVGTRLNFPKKLAKASEFMDKIPILPEKPD